ncbi:cryptochrome/photolyase family protein [Microlunatus flavus]|uniref:Deoxyribodipyrimidine photo-lyase n=1 Tax=Microlunatus flavus TaxID=1036181 RepID=A0A1H9LMX0_9ACTN|nr:deoxyribodipyrimidine photo-lyase [Microlunatus flavus]SER12589.1 deoxyribodipyrimidine photo-lyase [Microlunatus flavus]
MADRDRPTIWWVRRDFRLADNPALGAALEGGAAVLPLFVSDPVLRGSAGRARAAWLAAARADLDRDLREAGGPGLSVVEGRPEDVVAGVAAEVDAPTVHVSADFGPYGRLRDARVADALTAAGRELHATGSPYGVAPGTLLNQYGTPFSVFSPFHRTWLAHGVHGPAPAVAADAVTWTASTQRVGLEEPDPELARHAGERAARASWHAWLARGQDGPADYKRLHDVPAVDATAHVSKALRWGHLHPRTLLADLAELTGEGPAAIARQVAWRDFYADVLWHRPDATRRPVQPRFRDFERDDPRTSGTAAARLDAWQQGRTGYPLVDAGMRQMLAEGWMHNRVRLVVGSFLVKDLHLPWEDGAAWFMEHLHDGDVANNQLNWQWVAGCGNDPSPFYRVFNPVLQSQKFDPDGAYIRRWVPELGALTGPHVHEPWLAPGGPPAGYPGPVVDHKAERLEALDRYQQVRG